MVSPTTPSTSYCSPHGPYHRLLFAWVFTACIFPPESKLCKSWGQAYFSSSRNPQSLEEHLRGTQWELSKCSLNRTIKLGPPPVLKSPEPSPYLPGRGGYGHRQRGASSLCQADLHVEHQGPLLGDGHGFGLPRGAVPGPALRPGPARGPGGQLGLQ